MGIVISGTRSGVGKTTISSAIMGALDDVAPFKAGPDYIDPRFHEFITGKNSYNLDLFMCGEANVKKLYTDKAKGSVGVVEGVMGLYDGLGNDLDNGSTAHLSRVLNLPVILVVDAKGSSTSVAAQVLGYQQLDPRVNIGGVILNNVSSEKLYKMLGEAIEVYTGIECLGYFPKDESVSLGSRHLGLKQAEELEELDEILNKLKSMAKKYIDLGRIIEIAKGEELEEELFEDLVENNNIELQKISMSSDKTYKGLKVAIAKDEAFSFYYRYNLEYLKSLGMELDYFSPLNNEEVPEGADYIYIGGGYPENFGMELEKNKVTKESLRRAHSRGVPIYAECGGYMYLASEIENLDGTSHKMCGILDSKMKMKNRLNIRRFGYIDLETEKSSGRAHEFHYSDVELLEEAELIFDAKKRDRSWKCGQRVGNTIGGYPHIHFLGNERLFKEIFKIKKK